MNSTSTVELVIPIHGMRDPNCAARLTEAFGRLPGLRRAAIDPATGTARVCFDPERIDLVELERAVTEAGCTMPTRQVDLGVQGMSCVACAGRVEGALGDLPGVLLADVHLGTGIASVRYVEELVTLAQMERAVNRAGYRLERR